MNLLEAALRRAVEDLAARGQAWALVGGFAVSARAEPRFTRDIDLAVAVRDDVRAEAAVRGLIGAGYHLVASVEQDATGRLATVRLLSPVADQTVVVDLLFASSGVEPEIVEAAEPLEVLPGLTLPVARTGHLIALKLLAADDETRPQDGADLLALLASATDADLADARDLAALIIERGYDRGRDLRAALDERLGG